MFLDTVGSIKSKGEDKAGMVKKWFLFGTSYNFGILFPRYYIIIQSFLIFKIQIKFVNISISCFKI